MRRAARAGSVYCELYPDNVDPARELVATEVACDMGCTGRERRGTTVYYPDAREAAFARYVLLQLSLPGFNCCAGARVDYGRIKVNRAIRVARDNHVGNHGACGARARGE